MPLAGSHHDCLLHVGILRACSRCAHLQTHSNLIRNSKLLARPYSQQDLVNQRKPADLTSIPLPCPVFFRKAVCPPKVPQQPHSFGSLTPLPGSSLSYAHVRSSVYARWPALSADFSCPAFTGPPTKSGTQLHQPLPRGPQSGLSAGARAAHSDCAKRGWPENRGLLAPDTDSPTLYCGPARAAIWLHVR